MKRTTLSRARPWKAGENAYFSKLTWEDVDNIRLSRKEGSTVKSLMEKYQVSRKTIYNVVTQKTWREDSRPCGTSLSV